MLLFFDETSDIYQVFFLLGTNKRKIRKTKKTKKREAK